ncbi:MAG TPA: helix-turn-helix domain-containing protein [Nitrososphaerales archaeon]|nr:helix-turn-helix domain-containing protein [Nitrososphaerales archaeon]
MFEAVLQCPQPHNWIRAASRKFSAEIEILDSKLLPKGLVEHLFDIQVEPGVADELLAAMKKDADVIQMEIMRSDSGHIYGAAISSRCTVCKQVARSKCFLESVGISSGERARWTVLGSDSSYKELIRSLEQEKIPLEVRRRRAMGDTDLLTTRQEQILSIAYELGYFDFPKKLGLKELADRTGVRTSTLGEILRRGQRKVLAEYLARRSLLHRSRD